MLFILEFGLSVLAQVSSPEKLTDTKSDLCESPFRQELLLDQFVTRCTMLDYAVGETFDLVFATVKSFFHFEIAYV